MIICQIDENNEPKTKRVLRDEVVNDNKIAPKPPKPLLSNSLILVAPPAPNDENKSLSCYYETSAVEEKNIQEKIFEFNYLSDMITINADNIMKNLKEEALIKGLEARDKAFSAAL